MSAAVVPMTDGDGDAETADLADALSDLLRLMTDHHIVDPKMADAVAGYRGASAEAGYADARALVASAKEHHFAFRNKKAMADIERAISMLEGVPLDRESGPLVVDAYLSKALIAAASKDDGKLRDALHGALSIDPLLKLNRGDYPPKVSQTFDEIRGDLSEGQAIAVKSKPQAAEVYLNGIMQGVTPLRIEGVPAGSYSLTIAANRYRADERTVTVVPGKDLKIKSRLEWGDDGGSNGARQNGDVREGLAIAKALKVERVVLLDVDERDGGKLAIGARTIDANLNAGMKPLSLPEVLPEYRHNQVAELANMLVAQLDADVLEDPAGMIDPVGEGDPIVLGKRKKPLTRRPLFWSAIGVGVVGAIVGGVLAAMSSGGSKTGSVKVSFE